MNNFLSRICLVVLITAVGAGRTYGEGAEGKWFVQGHVIQVIEGKGILLRTKKSKTVGMPEPKDHSLVFVAGVFNPLIEGDAIAMHAKAVDVFRYTTVLRSARVVQAFEVLEMRNVLPPLSIADTRR